MKKIVINNEHGGFNLSYEGVMEYAKMKGIKLYAYISDYTEHPSKMIPFDGSIEDRFCIHYYTEPLENKKGNTYFLVNSIVRDDPELIAVVEKLGEKANERYSNLKIVEIPDDVKWVIQEYDGNEWVAEEHRTWS